MQFQTSSKSAICSKNSLRVCLRKNNVKIQIYPIPVIPLLNCQSASKAER